jgi:hypothetical protein
MTREERIRSIALIVVVGFAMAVFYHYWQGTYLEKGYPYNTFLFRPEDRWNDFYRSVRLSGDPYAVPLSSQQKLPLLNRYASIFSVFPRRLGLFVHLASFTGFFLYAAWVNLKSSDRLSTALSVFVFSFLSYPFLISIDRANFEIAAFVCIYLFVAFYKKHSLVSALFLALAMALKVFPAILAILLLSDRRFRELIVAAAVALGLTLGSYMSYPGGLAVNLAANQRNLALYNQIYAVGNEGLFFGNNLLGAVKFVVFSLAPGAAIDIYLVIGAQVLLLAGVVAYLVLVDEVLWRKVTLLACALNLLPIVSGDYKLLYLFVPLYLFINKEELHCMDWLYAVLFGLLLIPKNYYRIPWLPEANVGVLLNPLLMALIAGVVMTTGIGALRRKRMVSAAMVAGDSRDPGPR